MCVTYGAEEVGDQKSLDELVSDGPWKCREDLPFRFSAVEKK